MLNAAKLKLLSELDKALINNLTKVRHVLQQVRLEFSMNK